MITSMKDKNMKDKNMKDKINEVGGAGGMAGSDFGPSVDRDSLAYILSHRKQTAFDKKREYEKQPAKALNKKLYKDAADLLSLAESVQAAIEKDDIKLPDDYNSALDELINAAEDFVNSVEKHIK